MADRNHEDPHKPSDYYDNEALFQHKSMATIYPIG